MKDMFLEACYGVNICDKGRNVKCEKCIKEICELKEDIVTSIERFFCDG